MDISKFRLYRSNFYPTDQESNYLLSAYIEIKIFLFRIQTPLSEHSTSFNPMIKTFDYQINFVFPRWFICL